jgi:hypothetical protein
MEILIPSAASTDQFLFDIVLLQIARVLMSGDKSASVLCECIIPNATLARLDVFGSIDALTGYPSHHLKLANRPSW